VALTLKKGMRILFQGDSITDSKRKIPEISDMGCGYAHLISSFLEADYPELGLTFLNRGISGNRVVDLEKRWDTDCIALSPDVLSILIGVNDTWRRYDRNDPTSVEDFRDTYGRILERVRAELNVTLILCEPFLLPFSPEKRTWREDINPKIDVVRDLAAKYNALCVPFDGVFAAAGAKASPEYWTRDGIHPTSAGYALMARAWLYHVMERKCL
jgi:acyl-CoA thioesterase I